MSWVCFSKEMALKVSSVDLSAVVVPASLMLKSPVPSAVPSAVPSVVPSALPSALPSAVSLASCLPFLEFFRNSLPKNLAASVDAGVSDVLTASVSASEKIVASVNAAVKEVVAASDSAAASVVDVVSASASVAVAAAASATVSATETVVSLHSQAVSSVASLEAPAVVSEVLQLRSTVQADTEKVLESLKESVPSVELDQEKTILASFQESQKNSPQ